MQKKLFPVTAVLLAVAYPSNRLSAQNQTSISEAQSVLSPLIESYGVSGAEGPSELATVQARRHTQRRKAEARFAEPGVTPSLQPERAPRPGRQQLPPDETHVGLVHIMEVAGQAIPSAVRSRRRQDVIPVDGGPPQDRDRLDHNAEMERPPPRHLLQALQHQLVLGRRNRELGPVEHRRAPVPLECPGERGVLACTAHATVMNV